MSTTPHRPPWPWVVFDLDGTLVDTIGLITASFHHAHTTVLGHDVTDDQARAWIGRPLLQVFQESHPDQADALYASYLEHNRANIEALIRPYAGIRELLGDLSAAGVGLAVATSKRTTTARLALDLMDLSAFVTVLVALEDTAVHKPDPAPLVLAVERLGGRPESAAYVGDAAVDVAAGRAAAMSSIAVTWGAGTTAALAGADRTVTAVGELRSLLLGRATADSPK